ncbi:hypothetical protein D3C85_1051990 [compost metagenome]
MPGLFFDRQRVALIVEINYPETLWILDPVTENRCPAGFFGGSLQLFGEVLSVKNVIAQNQAHRIIADE